MSFDPLKSTTASSTVKRAAAAPAKAEGATPAPAANAVFGQDQTSVTAPATPAYDLTGLTAQEAGFVQEGFLPANFAELRQIQREKGKDAAIAAFRAGKKGPFQRHYGDPDTMLAGAKRWAENPQLGQMVKNIKPGDILMTTYNKADDVISMATKGPFVHAMVCVQGGPPAEFVEALGMSGDINDPSSNKVLRSMMSTSGYGDMSFRLLRPTDGMSPVEADKAIKRAIKFAEDQLGKPYDFAFTDTNGQGMNDAFYCSELAYKAYADPKGAQVPIAISKSSDRDTTLETVAQILDGLKPDDKGALTFNIAQLAAHKPLDEPKLVDYLVNEVAPKTEATRNIANTPERRAALKASIEKVIAGKAFTGTNAAVAKFSDDESKGRFKGVMGFFRRVGDTAKIAWNGVKDAHEITKGVGFWRTLGVAWKLGKTVVPHAQVLTNFLFGPDDARTKQAKSTLDTLDAMNRDVSHVPLVGGLLSKIWPLPHRPTQGVNNDFVSPTDLAWANVQHWDYNVKADHPIEQKVVEQQAKAKSGK